MNEGQGPAAAPDEAGDSPPHEPPPGEPEPISDDELVRVIGAAADDVKHATSTISASIRNIGIGLALLLYTLAAGEDKGNLLKAYRSEIVVASLAGVLCLMADAFQYMFLWRRKLRLLDRLRLARDDGTPITVGFVERADASWFKPLATMMFWLKCALALVGCTAVVYVLLLKLWAPRILAEPAL